MSDMRDKSLGDYFGDAPGTPAKMPQSKQGKFCPLLDKEHNAFCTLDGELCPFVGFNYRQCKKYINKMSKSGVGSEDLPIYTPKSKPPRLMNEEKKTKRNFFLVEDADSLTDLIAQALVDSPEMADIAQDFVVKSKSGDLASVQKDIKKRAPNLGKDAQDILDTLVAQYDELSPEDQEKFDKTLKAFDNRKKLEKVLGAALRDQHGMYIDQGSRAAYDDFVSSLADALDKGPNSFTKTIRQLKSIGKKDRNPPRFPRGFGKTKKAAKTTSHSDYDFAPPDAEPDAPPMADKPPVSKKEEPLSFKIKKIARTRQRTVRPPAPRTSEFKSRKVSKRKTVAGPPVTPRHEFSSTYSSGRDAEQFKNQFNAAWKRIPDPVKKKLFRNDPQFKDKEDLFDYIEQLEKTNDKKEIDAQYRYIMGRLEQLRTASRSYQDMIDQFNDNVRVAKKMGLVTDRDLRDFRNNTQLRQKSASNLNKLFSKFSRYDLETKTLHSAGKDYKVSVPVKRSLLPKFTRQDYEVARMAEQAGLMAIQKQHQYGQDYGKYNARNLFIKQVVAPLVLAFTNNAHLIQPLMSLWPQGWIDAKFFAKKDMAPKLSADDKYRMSQHAVTPRGQRQMRKGVRDNMMPSNRAVLHKRSTPTANKKQWNRQRREVLRDRYRSTHASNDWRKSYSR